MVDSNLLMEIAVQEALSSPALVRPNPRVGAALCSLKREIVSGHHKVFGGPHAEIEVLRECQKKGISTVGATMAVSLEPCSHFGKTPPCAHALVEAGIKKVLISHVDPNPKVSGRGIEILKSAGIEVEIGLLEKESRDLNKDWLFAQENQRPFVRIKMATSLDGVWRAASGQSQWITGPLARQKGHDLRFLSMGILTGAGTVNVDDPELTARNLENGQMRELQPKPYVFFKPEIPNSFSSDPEKEIPEIFKNKKLGNPSRGTEFVAYPSFSDLETSKGFFNKFLNRIFREHGVQNLLVEAGPRLTQWILETGGPWDEIHHFISPQFLGGPGALVWPKSFKMGHLPGFELQTLEMTRLGDGNLYGIWGPK